jgi:Possible hemagglutinin (DUF637)
MILAVVVAIIIVVVTQGTGAAYANALLGTAFTGATATAISAAYTALLVGMSTQLITTGRIDFRALFQNIVIAAITAGLVQGLTNFAGSEGFLSPSTTTGVPLSGVVNGNFVAAGNLSNGIIQAGIRATVAGGISAATGQGNFGQAFTGSVVSSLAAAGANWIGDQFPAADRYNALGQLTATGNPIGNTLAHAILGCAAAAAQRGDCASGAAGAAIGELTAPLVSGIAQSAFNLNPNSTAYTATVQGVSSLVGGLVTSAIGGSGVQGVNAANNAVANNFLIPRELSDRARLQALCTGGNDTAACNSVKALDNVSMYRQATISEGCIIGTTAQCTSVKEDLVTVFNSLRSYADELAQRVADPSLTNEERVAAARELRTAQNHVYQAGGLLVTSLQELHQRTGDETYRNAAAGVYTQMRGSELAGALQMANAGGSPARLVNGVDAARGLGARAVQLLGEGGALVREWFSSRTTNLATLTNEEIVNLAGSARYINPGHGDMNCVNCAIAMDDWLAGRPIGPVSPNAPREGTDISVISSKYNANWSGNVSQSEIEAILSNAAPGARIIVYGAPSGGGIGHVWNGVNQNTAIRFIEKWLRNFAQSFKWKLWV